MSAKTPAASDTSFSEGGESDQPDGRWRRARNQSSGQSPEREKTFSPNIFDFEEGEETFMETPEALVKKLRENAKKRSIDGRRDSIEAVPFLPDESVETIGGAYVEEERSLPSVRKREVRPHAQTAASPPHSISSAGRLPHSDTIASERPSTEKTFVPPRGVTRDLLRREEKMERQIQDLQVSRWKPPLIPDTINRMLLGMPCCLEWYKSMEEKRALLDAAVATYDGNCITAVLLFIRKTIDINLLVGMLLRRPIAAHHYCSLLKQLGAWNDVATIYRMLGDYESLGYLNLQQCEHWESPAGRVRKLKTCHGVFKTYPELQPDAPFVDEYCKLTEKQIAIQEKEGRGAAQIHRATSILFQPLTTTLLYCCRYHRNEPETHVASPEGLRKAFNISEKQFFQILLLALCVSRDWDAVDALFTSKGVFGISKKKKSPIGFERVVKTLASRRNRAPEKVITKYVMEIEDPETRLSLATEAEVFDVGIDTLKQLKDRERLSNYISFIPSHRQQEFRKKIQTLLSNTQIRWK